MIVEKACWERGCACYDHRLDEGVEVTLVQREWQGLTDEDREEIDKWIEFKEAGGNEPVPAQKLITYVEAKLKEKNNAI